MALAAIQDYVNAAPVSFVLGLMIGFWIGGRFIIRKHSDDTNGSKPRRREDDIG